LAEPNWLGTTSRGLFCPWKQRDPLKAQDKYPPPPRTCSHSHTQTAHIAHTQPHSPATRRRTSLARIPVIILPANEGAFSSPSNGAGRLFQKPHQTAASHAPIPITFCILVFTHDIAIANTVCMNGVWCMYGIQKGVRGGRRRILRNRRAIVLQ